MCQPSAADTAFLGVARRLVERFGMEAFIAGVTRPEHNGWFAPDRFAEFAAAVPEYAAAEREIWHRMFGPDEFPASTADAWQWVAARQKPG